MCRLQNIAMHDYQESVTTGQTDARQTESDPYVLLCFTDDTIKLALPLTITDRWAFQIYILSNCDSFNKTKYQQSFIPKVNANLVRQTATMHILELVALQPKREVLIL